MEYVTQEDVYEAYIDCIRRKRSSKGFLEYYQDWIHNNYQLYLDLNNKTYTIGKSRVFIVTRPKLREVFCALFRDRIVHHLLVRKFNPIFESLMIDNSFSCRKDKGTLAGVKSFARQIKEISKDYTKETWVLKCDLKGFFMSIDRNLLYNIVEFYIKTYYKEDDIDWWLWLWKLVMLNAPENNCYKKGDLSLWKKLPKEKSLFNSNGKGLPIGNLSSQVLANLFLSIFDRFVEHLCQGYGRYVDDFALIDNDKEKLLSLIPLIRGFLDLMLGVTLHPNKIYLQEVHKGLPIIGGIIKPNRIYSSNRCVNNMLHVIDLWNKIKEPSKRDIDIFIAKINSYFGFLKQTSSYAIKYRMWNKIQHKDILECVNMNVIKIKQT